MRSKPQDAILRRQILDRQRANVLKAHVWGLIRPAMCDVVGIPFIAPWTIGDDDAKRSCGRRRRFGGNPFGLSSSVEFLVRAVHALSSSCGDRKSTRLNSSHA